MDKLAANGGTPVRTKPWPVWPVVDDEDVRAVADVIRSGDWFSTGGGRVGAFEEAFAAFQGAAHGITVNSGTAALQIALMVLGVGPATR
jgi:dTDP-4-amino-4,6-dideoxygalactose transaminase